MKLQDKEKEEMGDEEEAEMFEGGDEEEEEEEEGGDGESGTVVIKDGEYMIHMLIEEAKTIDLEGEDTTDPMVKVSILGKS